MKRQWKRVVEKVDALTLRERVLIFGAAVALVMFLIDYVVLEPQFAQRKNYIAALADSNAKLSQLQAEISATSNLLSVDPDAANKNRLAKLQQQLREMQMSLKDVQKGLVSPDKMSELLQSMLRQKPSLRLVALRTLPTAKLNEFAQGEGNAEGERAGTAAAPKQTEEKSTVAVYTHGVEIIVQGGYFDLMEYLTELERMPLQVFWGKAALNVDDHPRMTLRLTLFTLSTDQQWLQL